jgi:hypothetical protein
MAVYLALGLTHAIFFFRLSKRTFIPQAMVMGFCFSRVASLALRIAWTTHVTDKNVAIAANVFINAGVLLLVRSLFHAFLSRGSAGRGRGCFW